MGSKRFIGPHGRNRTYPVNYLPHSPLLVLVVEPSPSTLPSQVAGIDFAEQSGSRPEPFAIHFMKNAVDLEIQVVADLVHQCKRANRVSQAKTARFINILGRSDPLLVKPNRLGIGRSQDPVGNKSGTIGNPHRILPDAYTKLKCGIVRLGRRVLPAHHLHEFHDGSRREEVETQKPSLPLRACPTCPQLRNWNRRRVGGNYAGWFAHSRQLMKDVSLYFEVFMNGLNHKINIRESIESIRWMYARNCFLLFCRIGFQPALRGPLIQAC